MPHSDRTGQTVFAFDLYDYGSRSIDTTYPKTWQSPDGLGSGCAPLAMPPVRGLALGRFDFGYGVGGLLDHAEAVKAADAVWKTALPLAVQRAGLEPRDVLVIRYDLNGSEFSNTPGPQVYGVLVDAVQSP